eukprot:6791033-Prymnesium_polylepis.1
MPTKTQSVLLSSRPASAGPFSTAAMQVSKSDKDSHTTSRPRRPCVFVSSRLRTSSANVTMMSRSLMPLASPAIVKPGRSLNMLGLHLALYWRDSTLCRLWPLLCVGRSRFDCNQIGDWLVRWPMAGNPRKGDRFNPCECEILGFRTGFYPP